MKKIIRKVLAVSMALTCIVSQTGCSGKEPVSGSDFLLNTSCAITLYNDARSTEEQETLIQETFALCREYENRLSRTIAGSDIGRLNSAGGQPVTVDASTLEVIENGITYAKRSGGLFDITVGELAELWNFSGDAPSVPDAAAIEEAVRHVGFDKIRILSGGTTAELDQADGPDVKIAPDQADGPDVKIAPDQADGAGTLDQVDGADVTEAVVQLTDPQTKLDLGGIAKGYIADRAADFLKEKGVESAVLNFGGNIVCIGEKSKGVPFVIGVEKPFSAEGGKEKEILGTLEVSDMSVVTSGTYERKFYEDGKLYYHILDPHSGYPRDTDLDGVSILGPSSTDCDGLSTTCLMLGLERGKALIESMPGFEAVFVVKDGRVAATEGLTLTPVK